MKTKTVEESSKIQKELQELKCQIPKEVLENPAFQDEWCHIVENNLENKLPFAVSYKKAEKRIIIVPTQNNDNNSLLPRKSKEIYELKTNSNGGMEVTTSYGVMYDARDYYMQTGARPLTTSRTAILDVDYRKSIYNVNGIEIASSTYSKYNWGIGTPNFEMACKELDKEIITKGKHMPKSWNMFTAKPEIPEYLNNDIYITGAYRDIENPMILHEYSYQLDCHRNQLNRKNYLSTVHLLSPERIRIDDHNRFAEGFEFGHWELYGQYQNIFLNQTVDEAQLGLSLHMQEALSELKDKVPNKTKQYEILYEQVAAYNEKYCPKIKTRHR